MAYTTILADPPWTYKDTASAGARGAAHKYPLLTTEKLTQLEIQKIAAPDCALFLWATCPLIPDALKVMEAWGFTYKTVAFVWVKTTKVASKLRMGMGNWSRANAELVLLGTRGRPRRADAGVYQVIAAPPRPPHSRKPEAVRLAIERLMGPQTPDERIELFATQHAPGWACTGFDVDQRDIRDFLAL